ncbi:hypothetical protein [Hymenobacter glacieicola]|uniref:DUF2314 domain-containing protein n=1 Tax=Hymenobacter glacieicola TaxID=1562124 RepID=A0ABQ1WQP9_9BACT|nr:hypothetical protein [Hymenobacter glacieicola]GGG37894.1 hypothetical protein GCM10011378_12730 [Hymenobacter glacieicola]
MRPLLPLLLALLLTGAVHAQHPGAGGIPLLVEQLAQAPETLPELPLKEARRTLPQARQRYQRGLPTGASFYLTARILNEAATPETVVLLVDQWQGSRISGRILRLDGSGRATPGSAVEFEETAVLDWVLLRPNGAEEGNYLGKFLDLEDRLATLHD